MKDARRWCCLAALAVLAATVAAQEKSASSTPQTDALERARAAVERRLTARIPTMFHGVRVTAAVWAKGLRQIIVIASLQSPEPDSWPEDVADVYSMIWQALTKSEAFKPGEGFKAVDRIVVRATGLEGFAVDCPVKVVEESQGAMTVERMKGCQPHR